MRIRTLWGMRMGESMPELMVAWDEYSVDSYPEGFEGDCKRARESWGNDLAAERFIHIELDEQDVLGAFESITVGGRVDA